MMLTGPDVSGHQPNWVPADDDEFVFIKASEGSTFASDDAAKQLKAARDKSLQVGHYHFLWPDNPTRQAKFFVDTADIQPGDLLACDWEDTPGGHPTVADAAEFIAEVKRLKPEHRVGLYCNKSDWTNTTVKAGDFLWVANWTAASLPSIESDWHFWQWTDEPIDQNRASPRWQSLNELKAWASSTTPTRLYSEKWKSEYVKFGGGWVTPIDRTILAACAKASGWGTIRLSQGGLSTSVAASAKTHHGLAVGDIPPDGRTKAQVWDFSAHLLRSGIVPFPRGYGGDPWANQKHIHFASVESAAHAHQQLRDQITEWRAGGDGLVGNGAYNGPDVPLGMWASSPYNPKNIKPDTNTYVVDTEALNGRSVDGNIKWKRKRGDTVTAVQQVFRWGRWNVVTSSPTYYASQYLKVAT